MANWPWTLHVEQRSLGCYMLVLNILSPSYSVIGCDLCALCTIAPSTIMPHLCLSGFMISILCLSVYKFDFLLVRFVKNILIYLWVWFSFGTRFVSKVCENDCSKRNNNSNNIYEYEHLKVEYPLIASPSDECKHHTATRVLKFQVYFLKEIKRKMVVGKVRLAQHYTS